MDTAKIDRKLVAKLFVGSILFALLLRVVIGLFYYNGFDTMTWYMPWADSLQEGFWNAYNGHMPDLDYPPLYLFGLYVVGLLHQVDGIMGYGPFTMIIIKMWPIIFDILTCILLYKIFDKKTSPLFALVVSSLWAFNPAVIFNSSFWGQTDGMMIFFLILCFYLLDEKKPVAASIVFGLCALLKMQTLYFTPILLLELFVKYKPRKAALSLGAGLLTGIVGFLPFMIGCGKPFLESIALPFTVYFGGLGKYPYATLEAFNIYGFLGLNWVSDVESAAVSPLVPVPVLLIAFGAFLAATVIYFVRKQKMPAWLLIAGLTDALLVLFACVMPMFGNAHIFGTIMLIASLVLVIFLYLKGETRSPWLAGFLLMNLLFMLTTRQHERYQIIVLPLVLMAAARAKDLKLYAVYIAQSGICLVNQAMLLLKRNAYYTEDGVAALWYGQNDATYNLILQIFSFANVILFVVSAYLVIRMLLCKRTPEDGALQEQPTQIPEVHA